MKIAAVAYDTGQRMWWATSLLIDGDDHGIWASCIIDAIDFPPEQACAFVLSYQHEHYWLELVP